MNNFELVNEKTKLKIKSKYFQAVKWPYFHITKIINTKSINLSKSLLTWKEV